MSDHEVKMAAIRKAGIGTGIAEWDVSALAEYDRTDFLESELKRVELERDDLHRELMDLRYQLELAKA